MRGLTAGGNRMAVRIGMLFMLIPGLAAAGVTYDLSSRSLQDPTGSPTVVHFSVDRDQVRLESMTAMIFKAGDVYSIDAGTKTVKEQHLFTFDAALKQVENSVNEMEEMARNGPPERRASAEQAAAMMRQVYEHQRVGVVREFRMTDREELIGRKECRVWEEFEQGTKRLEICVAPTSSIPGGAEILQGMQSLCKYVYGAGFAFGVQFGPPDVWPKLEALGGVPIRIREFRNGTALSETTLTSERVHRIDPSVFEIPADYLKQEPSS